MLRQSSDQVNNFGFRWERSLHAFLAYLEVVAFLEKNRISYRNWPCKPGIAILLSTEFICGNKKPVTQLSKSAKLREAVVYFPLQ